jgi:5-formyltetrahydrofolate cyclo-ligase
LNEALENPTAELKSIIREEAMKKRDAIPLPVKKAKSLAIKDRLFSIEEFSRASSVLFYASFRSEVDTSILIQEAISMGKKAVLPKVDSNLTSLTKHSVNGMHETSSGYMGIPEPVTDPCCNIEEIDLIIVPGIAFDETGGRIGYGGGYYDRLLPRVKGLRPIVALAYEEQIYDNLPRAEHDIEMDIVLTDRKTIRVIKEQERL